ncbi:MAG TPA: CAP domain-containing protein [Mycobacteriales bacterium]
MSSRHSARHRRQVSPGRRLLVTLTVLLAGTVGLAGIVLVSAQFAHPVRPTVSPTVSGPAMLSKNGTSAQADREESVSRSSARGASAGPSPTPKARASAKASPTRTAVKPPATRPAPPNTSRPAPPASPNTSYLQQVLDLTNAERAKAGCPALTMDSRLQQAAQGHSQDMADKDYFAHNDPDGTTPWDRAEAAGYPNASGENIAMGYPTPAKVMEAWMNSSGHRANILNCESLELGVGYVVDDDRGAIWTQLFGFGG